MPGSFRKGAVLDAVFRCRNVPSAAYDVLSHRQEDICQWRCDYLGGFYEKLGDDIVNELVELLNQVDTSYRSEIREQMDLNFARFDAKLDQRVAELRAELRTELHSMKAELIKWMFLFWAGTALAGLPLR